MHFSQYAYAARVSVVMGRFPEEDATRISGGPDPRSAEYRRAGAEPK
jgi:hypothetical protein